MKYRNTLIFLTMINIVACGSEKNVAGESNKTILAQIKELGIEHLVEENDNPIEVITINPKEKLIRVIEASKDTKLGVTLSKGYELSKKFKGLTSPLSVKNVKDPIQNFGTSYNASRDFSHTNGKITIELSNNTDLKLKFLLYSKTK